MSDTSVKITIANRTYPLKIKSNEEEIVRKAEKAINNFINGLEKNYAITDKQDLLSMCLIQMGTELEKAKLENTLSKEAVNEDVNALISKLSNHLKSTNVL